MDESIPTPATLTLLRRGSLTPDLYLNPYTIMNRWERWVRIAHIEAENVWLRLLNGELPEEQIDRFKDLDARNMLIYVLGRLMAGDGVTPRRASPHPRGLPKGRQ